MGKVLFGSNGICTHIAKHVVAKGLYVYKMIAIYVFYDR